jgi:phage/plasmid-like protein (TIGR03299 family)
MSDEVETMMYRGEIPWHSKGNVWEDGMTVEDWIEGSGLNWGVELRQLYFNELKGHEPGEFNPRKVPGKFALVRDIDERVLTITGSSWNPIQPPDLIRFLDEYCRAGGARLETAGSLRGGKVVWALAELSDSASFFVSPRDKVKGYLLFKSPNEVGKATILLTTGVRVLCANTMAYAESEGAVTYSQNHLTEFDVEEAKERIEEAHECMAAAGRRAKILLNLKLSAEDAVRHVFMPVLYSKADEEQVEAATSLDPERTPRDVLQILRSIAAAPGATPGNGWGVLNGFTHWADHVAGVTGENAMSKANKEARLYRAWFGDTASQKLRVERKLLQLAK